MNNPVPRLAHGDILEALVATLRPEIYVEIGVADGSNLERMIPHVGEAHGVDKPPGSDAFFRAWGHERQIDFCFIDGDHSHEQVVKDCANARERLAPYGMIALHDTFPPEGYTEPHLCSDAYLALNEIEAIDWEMLTIPIVAGLTLLKRRLPPEWMLR
jgi:predicted O-methyltransferase YrrM